MSNLHVGDRHRVTATYRVAGVATDPTAATVKVRKPDGTVSTIAPTKVAGAHVDDIDGVLTSVDLADGHYHADIAIDQHGPWEAAFIGTGAVVVAEPFRFHVWRSDVLEQAP